MAPDKPVSGAADDTLNRSRNRMVGMWAAELLGLIGQAAHDYAVELVHAHEREPEESVVRRLARDLQGKVSIHEIREKLAHFLHVAKRQLLNGDRGEE
jgi:hypothetical protein